MARFANRNSSESSSSSRGSSRSSGRSSRKSKPKQDATFISLGDLSMTKAQAEDDDYQDLVGDLMDGETKFNLKVFLGPAEDILIKKGDRIMIKFKDYEIQDRDWVVGKAFLITED